MSLPAQPDNSYQVPRHILSPRHLRLDVILVLVGARGRLDRVSLADHTDVALEVALGAAARVIRVRQQRPLVVELVICRRDGERD